MASGMSAFASAGGLLLRSSRIASKTQQLSPTRLGTVYSVRKRNRGFCGGPSPVMSTQPAANVGSVQTSTSESASVDFVHYDGSSFALEYRAPHLSKPLRILVDPWLTGELVFGNAPSFFRAKKPLAQTTPLERFGEFDAIVLSQELPDHCHQPTLKLLPKDLPIVVPLKAVPVVEALGFKTVLPLAPGDRTPPFAADSPLASFSVLAGAGSLTGPPWSDPQLAFCFEFKEPSPDARPLRIYHETHGMHNDKFLSKVSEQGRVDAAIGPVVGTYIPLLGGYPAVNGGKELLQMCRDIKPRVVVPFDNSRTPASGFLTQVLKAKGSKTEFRDMLEKDSTLTDVLVRDPEIMKPVTIAGAGVVA